jgi:hypothetical protein
VRAELTACCYPGWLGRWDQKNHEHQPLSRSSGQKLDFLRAVSGGGGGGVRSEEAGLA